MAGVASDRETGSIAAERDRTPHRRRRRTVATTGLQRQRLRLMYFTLASLWGFTISSAAVLGGLAVRGQRMLLDPLLTVLMIGAGLIALVGGAVTANAYRGKCERW